MTYDNDLLFEELSDLTNDAFRGWYMKMFYSLGKDKVLKLASIARADGKNKQRYFSKLLKEANNAKTTQEAGRHYQRDKVVEQYQNRRAFGVQPHS